MARSGNFETKIAGGSSGGYYVGVDWSINSQTSNPPKSNVTASVYVRSSGSGYTISSSVQKDVSVTINGTKYTGTNTIGIGTNVKKVLLTKTVDVPHNSDGTKSCSFAGSFYVGFTLSGTSLSTVSTSGTGYFDNITVNTPPSLGGSAWTNISGTIPENTGNITISWNAASDAQNNIRGYRVYRYVNGGHNHTLWPGGNSVTDNIGGFGEGTSVYYKIWAYDAFDAYSGEINSNTVTKNSLSGGWFTGHSADLGFSSNSVELYFTGGKNSNGSTVRYECYSDDVTVYNRAGTTGDRQTISIWRSGSYPSGPYIKFEDLKNRFKGSNYNGRLHVGLRTYNDYGTSKWSGGSIGVDLRTNITVASGSTSINSNSYYTIGSTNYLIPGRKNITLNWPAATDPLGTSITYRVEQNINGGGWSTLYNGATGTSHSFSLNVSGKPTYTFRVIARNGYGWEKELSGAPYAAMYTYSAPSVSITGTTRTADKLSVSISTGISTDIPGNAIKSLRWTFGSKSGTLATSAKSFDITGLAQTDSGTFSVIIEDSHGSSVGQSAITINGSVPQFYPVLSIRKNGVGINATPASGYMLYVNGKVKISGGAELSGTVTIGGGTPYTTSNKPDSVNSRGNVTAESGVGGRPSVSGLSMTQAYNNGYPTAYGNVISMRGHGDSQLLVGWSDSDGGHAPLYARSKRDNTSTADWSGWQQIYTTAYKPSASDIGALSLGGGTMNNKAVISWNTPGDAAKIYGESTNEVTSLCLETGDDGNADTTRIRNRHYSDGLRDVAVFERTNIRLNGDVYIQNHCRIAGNNAYYFESHGGGWHMTDSTWIRAFNGKNVYTPGTSKANVGEFRYIRPEGTQNMDLTVNGGSMYFSVNASSGCALYLNRNWSGNSGSEPSFYNNKGNGWGFIGNSGTAFFRVYGSGGSVSDRNKKYEITQADPSVQYENAKSLNIYNYRTISTLDGDDMAKNYLKDREEFYEDSSKKVLIFEEIEVDGIAYSLLDSDLTQDEIYAKRIVEIEKKNKKLKECYREDLSLGCMIDEMPLETTFYDNEGGDGKSVDMYSYTTMILGALQESIKKIEMLERKVEELENGIRS